MKKFMSIITLFLSSMILVTGCAAGKESSSNINLVSREDGSGTRGAFTEITGVLEKDSDGNKVDRTSEEAIIQNSTSGVMQTIEGDPNAIGYVSLSSANDSVKVLKIEGVAAISENIKNGSYKLARPFNVVFKKDLNALSKDFLNFILSADGQEIVQENGLTAYSNSNQGYKANPMSGTLRIAGSTSVAPLMEVLAEKYMEINPEVSIEIQATGSSAGVQAALEDVADLGMVSRELKAEESDKLEGTAIAIDGIALIVNKENSLSNLSLDEVKSIWTGEITSFNDLKE